MIISHLKKGKWQIQNSTVVLNEMTIRSIVKLNFELRWKENTSNNFWANTSTKTKDHFHVHFLHQWHGVALRECNPLFLWGCSLLQCTLCHPHLLLPRSVSVFFFFFDITPLFCLMPAEHAMCLEGAEPLKTHSSSDPSPFSTTEVKGSIL